MAGNALIGPTPRNPLWGTVADALSAANIYAERPGAGMPGGKANPVLSHLAQFLSLGDIAQTVDRASYGLPQTSGQGMARQLLPEARNALLAMAPNAVRNPMGAIRTVGGLAGAADTGMAKAIFMGANSRTWDKAAAAKAEQMLQSGADPRAVWKETGTFRSPDGALRQEIDDSAARAFEVGPPGASELAISRTGKKVFELPKDQADAIRNEARDASQKYWALPYEQQLDAKWPLYDKVAHPELKAAYPDTASISVGAAMGRDVGGLFDESQNLLRYGGGPRVGGFANQDTSVALHELQHAIQQREGFAQGGSPDTMQLVLDDLAAKKRAEANSLIALSSRNDPLAPGDVVKPGARKRALEAEKLARELESWRSRINSFGDGYANDAYRHLAGEAEARAVQARMNMTPQQRRAAFPLDSYDVPLNQLIVRR